MVDPVTTTSALLGFLQSPGGGAIVGGLGAGLGSLFGGGQSEPTPGSLWAPGVARAYRLERQFTAPMWDKLESQLRGQLGEVESGFERTRNQFGLAGYSAKRGLLDREAELMADIEQRNAALGLSSVTQPLSMRGLHSQTGRGLASIQENLGQLFGGLEQYRTQARLGIQSALAGVTQSRLGREQHYADMYAQAKENNPEWNPFPRDWWQAQQGEPPKQRGFLGALARGGWGGAVSGGGAGAGGWSLSNLFNRNR